MDDIFKFFSSYNDAIDNWYDIKYKTDKEKLYESILLSDTKFSSYEKSDFISENLHIQSNLIEASAKFGVQKFIFLGSVCIYPKFCSTPIRENSLLSGELEPTNEAYAIAKIAAKQRKYAPLPVM